MLRNPADRAVRPLLEEFLSAHGVLTYAIAVSLEGYCPTHNRAH